MDWEDDDFEEIKSGFSKSTFKRILPFFRGHGTAIVLAVIGVLLVTAFSTLIPIVFKKLIDGCKAKFIVNLKLNDSMR